MLLVYIIIIIIIITCDIKRVLSLSNCRLQLMTKETADNNNDNNDNNDDNNNDNNNILYVS